MRSLSRLSDVFSGKSPRSLLIVAPHPDDELFGCGLLIADALRRGLAVTVVLLTDGEASHPGSTRWPPRALARLRRSETRRALARLGAGSARVRFLGLPDGGLTAVRRSLALRRSIVTSRADLVAVTSARDFHPDHQAAARLTRAAIGDRRVAFIDYEVWSRVGPGGTARARHPALARKAWAARAYRSQTSPYINDDPAGFVLDTAALRAMTMSEERYRMTHRRG